MDVHLCLALVCRLCSCVICVGEARVARVTFAVGLYREELFVVSKPRWPPLLHHPRLPSPSSKKPSSMIKYLGRTYLNQCCFS